VYSSRDRGVAAVTVNHVTRDLADCELIESFTYLFLLSTATELSRVVLSPVTIRVFHAAPSFLPTISCQQRHRSFIIIIIIIISLLTKN